jgi:hypothetical protein
MAFGLAIGILICSGLPALAVSAVAALLDSDDLLPVAAVALCDGRRMGAKCIAAEEFPNCTSSLFCISDLHHRLETNGCNYTTDHTCKMQMDRQMMSG